jgi:hypothetical protein
MPHLLPPRPLAFRRRAPAAATAVGAVAVEAVEPMPIASGVLRRHLPAAPGAQAWWIDLAPDAVWPGAGPEDTGATCLVLDGEVIDGDLRHSAGTVLVFAPGGRPPLRSDTGVRLFGVQLSAEAFLGAGGDPAALGRPLHLQQG